MFALNEAILVIVHDSGFRIRRFTAWLSIIDPLIKHFFSQGFWFFDDRSKNSGAIEPNPTGHGQLVKDDFEFLVDFFPGFVDFLFFPSLRGLLRSGQALFDAVADSVHMLITDVGPGVATEPAHACAKRKAVWKSPECFTQLWITPIDFSMDASRILFCQGPLQKNKNHVKQEELRWSCTLKYFELRVSTWGSIKRTKTRLIKFPRSEPPKKLRDPRANTDKWVIFLIVAVIMKHTEGLLGNKKRNDFTKNCEYSPVGY